MDEDTDMKNLIRVRSRIKHKLINFCEFLEPIQDNFNNNQEITELSLIELKDRFAKCNILSEEFDRVQSRLEGLCKEDELETQFAVRDEFSNKYSSLLASAKLILCKVCPEPIIKQAADSEWPNFVPHTPSPTHSIPCLDLPVLKFAGNCDSWLEFKDTFHSFVHANDCLSDIQKFRYLYECLEDEPKKVIRSVYSSGGDYENAWKLICKTYNKKIREWKHHHIKSIFNIEPLMRESSSGLQNLVDSIYKHLRALEAINESIQGWDTLLIFIISSKLDEATIKEWEDRKFNDSPKLSDLTDFLMDRASFLKTSGVNQNHFNLNQKRYDTNIRQKHFQKLFCRYCNNNHTIYRCQEFLNLSVDERYNKITELGLCKNCLNFRHEAENCKFGFCKYCKLKHSSLLHKSTVATRISKYKVLNVGM